MTNAQAIYSLCNAICNTFYPDMCAIDVVMLNYGIDGEGEAVAGDPDIFRSARDLCMGYVEQSRSENGVATAVRSDEAWKRALRHWCARYGLDEGEELGDVLRVISDASKRW